MARNSEKELERVLKDLILVFVEGRGYQSCNPYLRPEVKAALVLLAERQGISDYRDVKLKEVEI